MTENQEQPKRLSAFQWVDGLVLFYGIIYPAVTMNKLELNGQLTGIRAKTDYDKLYWLLCPHYSSFTEIIFAAGRARFKSIFFL